MAVKFVGALTSEACVSHTGVLTGIIVILGLIGNSSFV